MMDGVLEHSDGSHVNSEAEDFQSRDVESLSGLPVLRISCATTLKCKSGQIRRRPLCLYLRSHPRSFISRVPGVESPAITHLENWNKRAILMI
jgi:hypothetical protein